MNLNRDEAKALLNGLIEQSNGFDSNTTVMVAPPALYLSEFAGLTNDKILVGAQDCSEHDSGAYTGEIAAGMLHSIGASFCLVGHSERRSYHAETEDLLSQKVDALLANNVTPVYCCGEQLDARNEGNAERVVEAQIKDGLFHLPADSLRKVVVAYEPVWAIGTGVTATSDQAQEMHAFIRGLLHAKYNEVADEISILYGGSCNPANAKELFANQDVDGGLVGGASLKVDAFSSIINSF